MDIYAGRELGSVEELARRAADAIREIRPTGLYALGGYCFGGVVAFEAARQLSSAGQAVTFVALFDTPAPGYPKIAALGLRYWREMMRVLRGRQPLHYSEVLEHVQVVGRTAYFRASGAFRRVAPRPLSAASPDSIAQTARMYVPGPINVPVAQFLARDQHVSARVLEDPRLGWRSVCRAGFDVRQMSGAHGLPFFEQHAEEIAAALGGLLNPGVK